PTAKAALGMAKTLCGYAAQGDTISPFFAGRFASGKLNPDSRIKLQQLYCCHTWQPGAQMLYQLLSWPNSDTQSYMA
ncbi:UNVERIFIED_CONTAM: hypothetical protein NY603_41765, partial [Bacteroidetes bacterium 56_B9]